MAYYSRQSKELYSFNLRLAIVSVIAVVVVGLSAYFIHRAQLERVTASLYRQAEIAIDAEEFAKANRYLQRYLLLRPNDREARIAVAEAFDKSFEDTAADRQRANLYAQAIDFFVEDEQLSEEEIEKVVEMVLRHCEIRLRMRDYQDLLAATEILARFRPESAELSRYEALAQTGILSQREFLEEVSASIYEGVRPGQLLLESRELLPSDTVLSFQLATLLRTPERHYWFDPDWIVLFDSDDELAMEADRVIEDMIAASDGNEQKVRAFLTALSYASQFDLPTVDSYRDSLLEVGSESAIAWQAAGAVRLRQARESDVEEEIARLLDEARLSYQNARDLASDQASVSVALADVEFLVGDYQTAIKYLDEATRLEQDRNPLTRIRLVEALLRLPPEQRDESRIDELISKSEEDIAGYLQRAARPNESLFNLKASLGYLKGITLIARGDHYGAVRPLRIAIDENVVDDEIRFRALSAAAANYEILEQWDLASESYKLALELRPNDQTTRSAVTRVATLASDFKLAAESAIKSARDSGSASSLYLANMSRYRQFNRSIVNVESIRELQRGMRNLDLLIASGNDDSIPESELWRVELLRLDIEQLNRLHDPELPLLDDSEVVKTVRDLLDDERFGGEIELQRRAVLILASLDADVEAGQLIAELSGNPEMETREVALLRAAVNASNGEYDAARILYREAIEASQSDTERLEAELQIASTYAMEGNSEEATRYLLQLSDEYKDQSRQLGTRIFNLAYENETIYPGEEIALLIRSADGPNLEMTNYLAARKILSEYVLQMDRTDDTTKARMISEAAKISLRLLRQRPGWPPSQYLAGLLEEVRGNSESAVSHYEQAIQLGDNRPRLLSRTIEKLIEQNEALKAEEILNIFGSQIPFSDRLMSTKLGLAATNNRLDDAERLARTYVAARNRDYISLIRLGQILFARERFEEAEECFLEAKSSNPEMLASWNWLFNFYVNWDRPEKAQEILSAIQNEHDEGNFDNTPFEIEMLLAQSYVALKNRQQALRHFESARRIDPSNLQAAKLFASYLATFDPDRARVVCEEILVSEEGSQDQDMVRLLASILTNIGDEQSWQTAVDLLQGSGKKDEANRINDRLAILLYLKRSLVEISNQEEYINTANQMLSDRLVDAETTNVADTLLQLSILTKQAEMADHPREQALRLDQALTLYDDLTTKNEVRDVDLYAYLDLLFQRHSLEVELQRIPATTNDTDWLTEANELLSRMEGDTGYSFKTQIRRVRYFELKSQDEDQSLSASLNYIANALEIQLSSAETDNERAATHLTTMQVYRFMGLNEAALEQASLSMSLNDDLIEQYALSLADFGDPGEAIQICLDAMTNADADKMSSLIIALSTIVSTHDIPETQLADLEIVFDQGRRNFADRASVLTAIGTAYIAMDRLDDGIEVYELALALEPDNAIILNNLATVLGERPGQSNRAKSLIHRAIRNYGDDPALLDTQGMVYLHAGELQEARLVLVQASRKSGADARVFFHLAYVHWRLDQVSDAVDALGKSIEKELFGLLLTDSDRKSLADMQADERMSSQIEIPQIPGA